MLELYYGLQVNWHYFLEVSNHLLIQLVKCQIFVRVYKIFHVWGKLCQYCISNESKSKCLFFLNELHISLMMVCKFLPPTLVFLYSILLLKTQMRCTVDVQKKINMQSRIITGITSTNKICIKMFLNTGQDLINFFNTIMKRMGTNYWFDITLFKNFLK